MMVALASLTFLLATVCAGLMGYAIQRGATCTVAAIGEIAEQSSARRLIALAEAALWVAGCLLIARWISFIPTLPGGFAVTGWTVAGGALLGVGAYINRACVFGAIARLGSGDWSYVLTPIGFFAGAASMMLTFGTIMPIPVRTETLLPDWVAIVFALYAVWRIIGILRRIRSERRVAKHVWAPHEATLIIGITFVIMLLSVGAWAYTDLLSRLAMGMSDNADWRVILFVALLGGATLGGWTAGRLSSRLPTISGMARCFTGGLLMGWGSALIPGGNDGLILIGMPLFQMHAWVAIFSMCATIWIAFKVEKALGQG
jgi:toxin CptA